MGCGYLDNLDMSRKRDHKIIITDEAIEKIPFIEYRGIPEEEYEIIHRLAKQVLQISKTENESKVVAREEVVAVQFGSEHSVNPMADPLSYHLIMSSRECAVISLHNHPSLSLISATDIRFFLEYRSICLLVIITNLGGISYLVKSKKYNYAKAVALLNETIRLHNEAVDLKGYQKAARFFINNCYRAGIIYEDR